jgi:DNA-binding beta-propeller fold protein YncE
MILKNLPVIPEYSMVGSAGAGYVPQQLKPGFRVRRVSFGSGNTVWAVDCDGHRVQHLKHGGEIIKTIGTGTQGNGPGQLNHPFGIALSRLGNGVFIGQAFKFRICEFSQSDGSLVRVLDTKGKGLSAPCCMCLSPDETSLAVASSEGHCIRIICVDGSEAPKTIGGKRGSKDGQLNCPADVQFTPNGKQLVVADFHNRRVQVLGLDGSFVRKMLLDAKPRAVSVDAVGNIIVATQKSLKLFSSEGMLLHNRLSGREFDDAAFGDLAIDPASGRVVVTEIDAGKTTEHTLSYL